MHDIFFWFFKPGKTTTTVESIKFANRYHTKNPEKKQVKKPLSQRFFEILCLPPNGFFREQNSARIKNRKKLFHPFSLLFFVVHLYKRLRNDFYHNFFEIFQKNFFECKKRPSQTFFRMRRPLFNQRKSLTFLS